MKNIFVQKLKFMLAVSMFISIFVACEQENLEPEMQVAPGGGTLTGFKAYTLDSIPAMNEVYGRIVFWKESTGNTLVEIGLYNTEEGIDYPTGVYTGKAADGSVTKLIPLYSVNGASGKFKTHKFYIITDKTFYEKLSTYNAHVDIYKGTDLITIGDIGANADPIDEN